MAVTAVFCLISSWNEFGFAMTLNNYEAKTVPVYFAGLQGNIDEVEMGGRLARTAALGWTPASHFVSPDFEARSELLGHVE